MASVHMTVSTRTWPLDQTYPGVVVGRPEVAPQPIRPEPEAPRAKAAKPAMLRWADIRPAALAVAPTLATALTLAAGVLLLASGATPSDPERLAWLSNHAPLLVIEASHFISSLIGLTLVMVAFGLKKRLGAAWGAAVALLATAAVLALLKGLYWGETIVLGSFAGLLIALRPAFRRTARLNRMEIKPGWLLSAFAAVLGTALLTHWSYHTLWSNPDAAYGDQLWWRVIAYEDASRSLRALAGAGALCLVFGLWRLIATPASPAVAGDHDPAFDQVRAILGEAERSSPDSNLALLGDKRFLFSASGKSFLMFGVRGRSWIALGAPVGLATERRELLWRFRELADKHAARPVFYAFGPDLLPDMVELGFAVQKTGESATVQLAEFSLNGRKREVLRRNWRKAGEAGASFEVIDGAETVHHMDELKAISDAWLAHHAGGEKSFSMGRFDPAYVAEFPCALVRMGGRIVAFASLWTTAGRTSFSMDLMRYGEDAPKNIMDFLFVELLEWGRAQGYESFAFGMAPLAGLEDRPLAPWMSRIGRLLFERGETLYNFQGVRRYKDKYDPTWAPRYIAAANKWAISFALADVSLLSAGGFQALTRRPKPQAPAPVAAAPVLEAA